MTQTAVVRKVSDRLVEVECAANPDCHSCSGCAMGKDSRLMQVLNARGLELREGDVVELYLSPGRSVRASFFVLIFPLLLFVLFAYLAGRVLPGLHEALRMLVGVAGLAVGFALNLLFRGRTRDLPEVVALKRLR